MRKLKLFLDTTIISFLFNPQRHDWEIETWALWEHLMIGKYEIVISDEVIKEIDRCSDPKRQKLFEMLAKINYIEIIVNDKVEDIADEIIRLGILKERNRIDCYHIACAMITRCDYLVSWNISDLAKQRTNNGIRYIAQLLNYPGISIITPYDLDYREEQ